MKIDPEDFDELEKAVTHLATASVMHGRFFIGKGWPNVGEHLVELGEACKAALDKARGER